MFVDPSPVSAHVIKSLNEIPTTEGKKAKEHGLRIWLHINIILKLSFVIIIFIRYFVCF